MKFKKKEEAKLATKMFKPFLILTTILIINLLSVNASDEDEYEQIVEFMATDSVYQKDFEEHLKSVLSIDETYLDYKPTAAFNCDTNYFLTKELSEEIPTVHSLKPSDIKVVAAMGDSLTAALGGKAKNVIQLLTEYRGGLSDYKGFIFFF